jgi:hypothetical protein
VAYSDGHGSLYAPDYLGLKLTLSHRIDTGRLCHRCRGASRLLRSEYSKNIFVTFLKLVERVVMVDFPSTAHFLTEDEKAYVTWVKSEYIARIVDPF